MSYQSSLFRFLARLFGRKRKKYKPMRQEARWICPKCHNTNRDSRLVCRVCFWSRLPERR